MKKSRFSHYDNQYLIMSTQEKFLTRDREKTMNVKYKGIKKGLSTDISLQ